MSKLRVLHYPWTVGGNPGGLAAAERELGLDSTVVTLAPSPFGYPVDEVLWQNTDGRVAREVKRWRLLVRALREFDVIHFNFGDSIAPRRSSPNGGGSLLSTSYAVYSALFEQRDLPVLARAGKGIFVTFQGDDARQGDVASRFEINAAVEAPPGYYTPSTDAAKRRRIAHFDRYADAIYALNPDLLRVLPTRARFEPYAHVDTRFWEPGPPAGERDRPLILHAPTNRAIKGTRFLLEAVDRLRSDGLEFDFTLVEGLTHEEAKTLYRQADLVVDQLLIGWYGGFAIEVMALERPVVAYLRESDLRFLPSGMRADLPAVSADPRSVYDVLKDLLTKRRTELSTLGRQGRAYVEKWHNPLTIAKRLAKDYEHAVSAKEREVARR